MVGPPRVIGVKADLINTYKFIKKGRLKKKDWLAAIEKLGDQSFILYPILEETKDRKGVTLMSVNGVTEGNKVKAGNTTAIVKTVEHIEVEKAAEADQEAATVERTAATDVEAATNNNQTKHAIPMLSKTIAANAATTGVPAKVTSYDRLGIIKEGVEQMKGELV